MNQQQIEEEVMRRYPKNQDELRNCQMTILMRNGMRKAYREHLTKGGEIKHGTID